DQNVTFSSGARPASNSFSFASLREEQFKVSRTRAEKRGLADRVRFELQDYRTMTGRKFDRIVSVGMFEHVGIGHYGNFF
ncbi:SAM-dependent methyltransferase, partial [Rhizobium leguminosarum]|uniref:SAM-dependent methyltransferase n=1 Tax=Rhizobium leguminosarum TaxID=384 RepID=UPI003F9E5975